MENKSVEKGSSEELKIEQELCSWAYLCPRTHFSK